MFDLSPLFVGLDVEYHFDRVSRFDCFEFETLNEATAVLPWNVKNPRTKLSKAPRSTATWLDMEGTLRFGTSKSSLSSQCFAVWVGEG